MTGGEFLAAVAREGDLPRDEATRAVQVTLESLGERVPVEVAERLAGELPPSIGDCLRLAPSGRGAGDTTLVDQVARRRRMERGEARSEVRAVLEVLRRVVEGPELGAVSEYLSPEGRGLLARGGALGGSRGPG